MPAARLVVHRRVGGNRFGSGRAVHFSSIGQVRSVEIGVYQPSS
ncbi:hypothetical protein CFter6_3282 [Collimonas fungivorans]|uniref:Uncharacterized protein n=1 Tax=Collimonas fungivorans TaxID=158899 RepID=A0A127PDZ2_9BURK|nr:hypothetical protein CFter6_3282 [Collimonas fungivorans]